MRTSAGLTTLFCTGERDQRRFLFTKLHSTTAKLNSTKLSQMLFSSFLMRAGYCKVDPLDDERSASAHPATQRGLVRPAKYARLEVVPPVQLEDVELAHAETTHDPALRLIATVQNRRYQQMRDGARVTGKLLQTGAVTYRM